jgi:uncharacterized protein (TIGR03000 family)
MNPLLLSVALLGLVLPPSNQAQFSAGVGTAPGEAGWYSPGFPPPVWNYPYLAPGPYLTTEYPFAGWPGYRGAYGNVIAHGPNRHRPQVPVYAPLPATFECEDPGKHVRRSLGFGLGHYGWIGPYAASPRPKALSVSIYAIDDPRCGLKKVKYPKQNAVMPEAVPGPSPVVAPPPGKTLVLEVRVPKDAEVLVDGTKTTQTGTDRVFESPPLQGDGEVQYELTARWTENGKPVERKRVASGKPGDVVRVDLTVE